MNNDISYEVRPKVPAYDILKLFSIIVGLSFSHSTTRTECIDDTFEPTNDMFAMPGRKKKKMQKVDKADKEICKLHN